MSVNPEGVRWPVLVDARSGWVRLGEGDPDRDVLGAEFAPGVLAVLEGDQITAIWLQPEQLPQLDIHT